MTLLERLFSIGPIRKGIWRLWYPFLTRRLRAERVYFLNYAFQEQEPVATLEPAAPHQGCLQLYQHVADQIPGLDWRGKSVLEVSCGHGGGAAWLAANKDPASYVGLDLNPEGIRFCGEQHLPHIPGLSFMVGDAQRLPFADASLDLVLNVEASHCYPDFPGFLREVARVLKPGGYFLYADFRFSDDIAAWEAALAAAPMATKAQRDIRSEVLRGMDGNAERNAALVSERLPKCLRTLGCDFAGVPGFRVYEALKTGGLSYRSRAMQKAQ